MNAQVHAQSATHAAIQADIHVRQNLDFGIDQPDMPRFWFDNNPFKTRIFDALSITFPVGERYFISSVRLFRDQITDPELNARVQDFIRQEAQHGIAHERYNQFLVTQGQPLDRLLAFITARMNSDLKTKSPELNLAMTAAAEHITALMAECFFAQRHTLAKAHPNMRAMLAWHAIEEMEHKAVVFDVLRDVANVNYATRAYALALIGVMMPTFTLMRANMMLKADGFSRKQRFNMLRQHLPWIIGKNGMLTPMRKPFMSWFRRDFHPNDHAVVHNYPVWLSVFEQTGDARQAGEAFWAAGH
ncbi:MAG: metal-dependent hydrolase [Pseudomonadota bacterium]|nr:metal-dependent hydrolase [Pseudomonadota bacterium]